MNLINRNTPGTTTEDIVKDVRKRARREAHIMFKAGKIDKPEYDRILKINANDVPIKTPKDINDPFKGLTFWENK